MPTVLPIIILRQPWKHMLYEFDRPSDARDSRAPSGLEHASLLHSLSPFNRRLLPRSLPLDVLPRALRDMYSNMSRTTESVIPNAFLTVLRHAVPQFNELDRSKGGALMGYAQQGDVFVEIVPAWYSSPTQMPKNAGFR